MSGAGIRDPGAWKQPVERRCGGIGVDSDSDVVVTDPVHTGLGPGDSGGVAGAGGAHAVSLQQVTDSNRSRRFSFGAAIDASELFSKFNSVAGSVGGR